MNIYLRYDYSDRAGITPHPLLYGWGGGGVGTETVYRVRVGVGVGEARYGWFSKCYCFLSPMLPLEGASLPLLPFLWLLPPLVLPPPTQGVVLLPVLWGGRAGGRGIVRKRIARRTDLLNVQNFTPKGF